MVLGLFQKHALVFTNMMLNVTISQGLGNVTGFQRRTATTLDNFYKPFSKFILFSDGLTNSANLPISRTAFRNPPVLCGLADRRVLGLHSNVGLKCVITLLRLVHL